jgi:hypothetical protein
MTAEWSWQVIKIRIDNTGHELNDDNFGEYVEALRAATKGSNHSGSTDRIVQKAREWAEAWEEYPAGQDVFDGYPALIEAAARSLRLLAENIVPAEHELLPKHFLDLKRLWVNISNDPTEAHQLSASLDTATSALGAKLQELDTYARIRGLKSLAPKVFSISKDFLENKYDCHHNAARAIRPEFRAETFQSMLNTNVGARSQFETYLAEEWELLTFSANV